jgi:hypothetical protein
MTRYYTIFNSSRTKIEFKVRKMQINEPVYFILKLRNVVKHCLNLNPEQRPDITQICQVAKQMHQYFQTTPAASQQHPHAPGSGQTGGGSAQNNHQQMSTPSISDMNS